MEKKFIMGYSDGIIREPAKMMNETYISERLKFNLLKKAIILATDFYKAFFNFDFDIKNYDLLVDEYIEVFNDAKKYRLFSKGGVREKDHLNFWCLGKVFSPDVYIESGVFIGSSLHAFLNSGDIKKIILIDPNLKNLRIPLSQIPQADSIDEYDFSQIDLGRLNAKSLVYFDDHINAAKRIIQSYEKGLKYLIIDDATGLEGVCQRLYPAVPTIPMINNYEIFNVGDEIKWSWLGETNCSLYGIIKKLFNLNKNHYTEVTLKIDNEFLQLAKTAKSLIKKSTLLPDLGIFMPQRLPEKMVNTDKYLMQLV